MIRRNKKQMKKLSRGKPTIRKKSDSKIPYLYHYTKEYPNGDVEKWKSEYRVYARNADGSTFTYPDGRRKEITAKTQSEVKRKEAEFLEKQAQLEKLELQDQADLEKKWDLSVAGLFNEWLMDPIANDMVAQKTRKKRKTQMRNHVLNSLGNIKVRDIQPNQMQSFFKDLGEIKKMTEVHKVLKPFFDYAISESIISNNPIPDSVLIDIQKVTRRIEIEKGDYKREPFNLEDWLGFFDSIKTYKNGKYELHYLSFGAMGLRISEAFGINWKNINLHENTIFIRDKVATRDVADDVGTRFESKKHLVIDTHLKSSSSIRTLPIPDAVRKHLVSYDYYGKRDGLLFRNKHDDIFGMKTFHDHHHSKVRADLGIDWTPHTFRHFYASYCLGYLGMSPYAVAKLMGHGTSKVVEDNYEHDIKSWDANPTREVVDHFGHFGHAGEIIKINKKDDYNNNFVGV